MERANEYQKQEARSKELRSSIFKKYRKNENGWTKKQSTKSMSSK